MYSGKSGCIRAKVILFGQKGCIRAKIVVVGQSGCIRAKVVLFEIKWLYYSKSGCNREKLL